MRGSVKVLQEWVVRSPSERDTEGWIVGICELQVQTEQELAVSPEVPNA